jgi:ABC-type lipoprotein release transport system permease subunit
MRLVMMAWRNLWRYKRRTAVTVGAMTLALLAMVLYTSLVEGYLQTLESNIVDIELGDVQMFEDSYRDRPSLYSRIDNSETLLAQLDAQGIPASARLLAGGLAAAGESSAGVLLKGVESIRDAGVSGIYDHLQDGSWLDPSDPYGVVVGIRLARILGVTPGDELLILGQAADGSLANDLYVVRGVLRTISDETDRATVFMTDDAFRSLFIFPDGVHQMIVRRPADQALDVVVANVRQLAPALDVQSWRDLTPTLASLLDSTRSLIQIVFFIVYIVIAILIVNAMLMAVFERIRELGVLKALGVGPERILALILIEGAFQTAFAIVIALLLSIPGLIYLQQVGLNLTGMAGVAVAGMTFDATWLGVVTPATIIMPVVTLVIIVTLSVLYPAVKASRISPVEAMHHQ